MRNRLTDEELIQLVQETPPEQLLADEVEQLRERLRVSPELQQTLLTQLRMESYLNAALGEMRLSVDAILSEAASMQGNGHWPLTFGLGGLMLSVGVMFYAFHASGDAVQPVAAPARLAREIPAEDSAKPDHAVAEAAAKAMQERPTPAKAPAAKAVPPDVDDDTFSSPSDLVELVDDGPPTSHRQEELVALASPQVSPAKAVEPWEEALDPREKPPTFAELARTEPESLAGGFPVEHCRRWFENVPGQGFHIHAESRQNREFPRLEGLGKLRAPWPADAVLRLAMFDIHSFAIHFWSGEQGVTLKYGATHQPRFWAAYRTTRQPGKILPERLALVASDGGMHERGKAGRLDIRHQDGALIVTQGGVRLLTAPLPNPPQEIYFEGHLRIAHLSLVRSGPAPESPVNPLKAVLREKQPSRLAWSTLDLAAADAPAKVVQGAQAAGAWSHPLGETTTLTGGASGVQLTAAKSNGEAVAFTSLPGPGLFEVIACVEDAQSGAGFYLGDARGRPLHRVSFLKDRRSNGVAFAYQRGQENATETEIDPNATPAPYAGERQWLRLVVGPRYVKLWTSGDGRHWGQALRNAEQHSAEPWSTIGLFTRPGEAPHGVRLIDLEVRELSALTTLADPTLRKQVQLPSGFKDLRLGSWLQWTFASRPRSVEIAAWRRACAVVSLEQTRQGDLFDELLRMLVREGLEQTGEAGEKLRILDAWALLGDFQHQHQSDEFVASCERAGARLARDGHARSLPLVTETLLTAPLWINREIEIVPPRLLKSQLLSAVNRADWERTQELLRFARSWRRPVHPDQGAQFDQEQSRTLAGWASALAEPHRPSRAARPVVLSETWRHPLEMQISKEGYNVMAEFDSAVQGQAWQDACKIIADAGMAGTLGLLPDTNDSRLLVSLPRALALAMRQHPPLLATMEQQLGRVGLLRVRQAMNAGDAEAVEAATVQFYSTQAAAEAHRWLGDRHLAGGRMAQALEHYRLAQEHAPETLARDAAARQRLAGALLGQEEGRPPISPLEINGQQLTPAEFEKLIADLLSAHRPAGAAPTARDEDFQAAPGVPAPTRFSVQTFAALDGEVGHNAGRGEFREIDWSGRQLAWAADASTLFVNNRYSVFAYDLGNGQTRWTARLGGEQGEAHHWPHTAMRPVLVGSRLYTRRLTNRGVEIVCLDATNGSVIWRTPAERTFAADPVLMLGKLVALLVTAPEAGKLQLEVAHLLPETGEIVLQAPLVRMRDPWNGQPPCQMIALTGQLICTIGGTTISCDPFGRPQWLRRDVWTPPEVNPDWRSQAVVPPVANGDRVYLVQSDVKNLACVELKTGREIWSQPVPELRRMLGVVDGKVILEVEQALEAYDAEQGTLLWRHDEPRLLEGCLADAERLLYLRQVKFDDQRISPALVWLDVDNGQELAQQVLRDLSHPDAQFGPLFVAGDKLGGFFGKGYQDPRRTLVQLNPQDGLPVSNWESPELHGWSDHVDSQTKTYLTELMPGWSALAPQAIPGKQQGPELQAEVRGEKQVLRLLAMREQPFHLARQVNVPPAGGKLRLRVGHDPGQSWRLEVKADGQTLHAESVGEESSQNGWKNVEIDLLPLAAQTVWFTVSQTSEKSDAAHGYWKLLEIARP